jgi:t-SNARE complex subunit (syntaxin)
MKCDKESSRSIFKVLHRYSSGGTDLTTKIRQNNRYARTRSLEHLNAEIQSLFDSDLRVTMVICRFWENNETPK